MWYFVVFVIWLAGAFLAYPLINKWDNTKFEKIIFTIIWPLVLPLYGIYILHKKM